MSPTTQPHAVDVHVGQRLRILRKEAALSQKQLASAVGVTFQQVQKYERGTNRVSASKLYEFAGVLQKTVADFYEGLPMPGTGAIVLSVAATRTAQIMALPGGPDLVDSYLQMAPQRRRPFVDLARSLVGV